MPQVRNQEAQVGDQDAPGRGAGRAMSGTRTAQVRDQEAQVRD